MVCMLSEPLGFGLALGSPVSLLARMLANFLARRLKKDSLAWSDCLHMSTTVVVVVCHTLLHCLLEPLTVRKYWKMCAQHLPTYHSVYSSRTFHVSTFWIH